MSRSAEPNWLHAQARVVEQVVALGVKHDCPLFVAGDVFTRWDASAELVTHVLALLRPAKAVYAIPGQHDMPGHTYDELHRSAYWTLIESGRVKHLPPGITCEIGPLLVTGFPWRYKITPPTITNSLCLNVAVIHAYIWTANTGYPGADPKHRLNEWLPRLQGYDAAFFGDNHSAFLTVDKDSKSITNSKDRKCVVMNCGGLQRLTSDQRAYRPRVGLLHADGTVTQHFLNVDNEKWSDKKEDVAAVEAVTDTDMVGLVEDLLKLRDKGYDWPTIVKRECERRKLRPGVRDALTKYVRGAE